MGKTKYHEIFKRQIKIHIHQVLEFQPKRAFCIMLVSCTKKDGIAPPFSI